MLDSYYKSPLYLSFPSFWVQVLALCVIFPLRLIHYCSGADKGSGIFLWQYYWASGTVCVQRATKGSLRTVSNLLAPKLSSPLSGWHRRRHHSKNWERQLCKDCFRGRTRGERQRETGRKGRRERRWNGRGKRPSKHSGEVRCLLTWKKN